MEIEKARKCQQCGELRPESMYRVYYNTAKKSRYKTCKGCEKINTRHKYLSKKLQEGKITLPETTELNKIDTLFEVLRQRGLKPPGSTVKEDPINIDAELEYHQAELARIKSVTDKDLTDVPVELSRWLTEDLSPYTPEELEGIGDDLVAKFRPQTGVDKNFNPIYDDTYRDVVNEVLRRFDDYADEYEG